MAGTDAGGKERKAEGSSLISRVISSRMFSLAWSSDKVKAPSFSNSSKKSSREGGGAGVKGFAGGLLAVRDSHSWAIPWRAPLSESGEALCLGGGAGSLEANLKMSSNYEVKKKKIPRK